MTPESLADLLTKVSGLGIRTEMIAADIAAGAPTNPDGSINFLRYVAWLLKQDRDDEA